MRWIFSFVITIHGLIHLTGPAKAFGYAELPQITQPISRWRIPRRRVRTARRGVERARATGKRVCPAAMCSTSFVEKLSCIGSASRAPLPSTAAAVKDVPSAAPANPVRLAFV
jgi:hypothetical protein